MASFFEIKIALPDGIILMILSQDNIKKLAHTGTVFSFHQNATKEEDLGAAVKAIKSLDANPTAFEQLF